MEKIDTRRLKPVVQEQLRRQVVQLRNAGKTYKQIAEVVGIHHTNACKIYKAWQKDGAGAIKAKKRGRKTGSCRSLDEQQEKRVRKAIVDKTPDQLKFPFALWTRKAVGELIYQFYGIKMPIRTVGEYLKRWGFTPQKPIRRAYEQNPKAVEKWLDEHYPQILSRAKKEKAQINWADETGLCNDAVYGRSYAPRGKTPAVRVNAAKKRVNLISAITNQGKVRFMIYHEAMNAKVFIRFCRRLIKDVDKKVFLIVDNLRVHHSNKVRGWVRQNSQKIELFFLPSYSPELNPDEYLNCDLKSGVHSGSPARNKEQLKAKAISHLRMLQKTPQRVKNYFKHPRIAYAA